MVKLVYTYALGAYAARRAGSSPVPGTIKDLNSTLANKTIPALLVIFLFFVQTKKNAPQISRDIVVLISG